MSEHVFPTEYQKYRAEDPFPGIRPALLNSADIEDYVTACRMVVPFEPSKLKPASYEVPFSGEVHWWDADNNTRRVREIKSKDDTFILESNAIIYVRPDTTFYLPDYIALRFNLRITHVHQGLLLGTGPLVDPGFCGRLLIPLHNMTSNPYTLVCGNGFIWVEFTKLSPWEGMKVSNPPLNRNGRYREFRDDKRFLEPDSYFRQAVSDRSIVSSIPSAVAEASKQAKRAADEAERSAGNANVAKDEASKALRRLDLNLYIGLLAILIASVGIIFTALQIAQNTLDSKLDAKTRASEEIVKAQIDSLQKELSRTKDDFARVIEQTKKQVVPQRRESNKK